jgi:putative ABC transport system permease protein
VTDLLLEGLEGILAHRVRSFLSTLGILFGVAAVIGILSIGEGARRQQELLINQMGILNFQLQNLPLPEDDEELTELRRMSNGLSRRDVSALATEMPSARFVGGMRELEIAEVVPVPDDLKEIRIIGADPAYLAGTQLVRLSGRPLTQRDEEESAKVCLLGIAAQRQLFGGKSTLGQRIRLQDVWVTVVGIVDDGTTTSTMKIDGVDIADRSRDIILPLSTALNRFNLPQNEPELTEIQVALTHSDEVPGHTQLARRIVDRLHRDQGDVEIVIPLKLLEQSRAQQRIFNLVMGLIAGISLLVGGIGIMNIMLASVLERTREVGIRLAIGATPANIRMLFLVEAALISLAGGLLGIGLGVVISKVVAVFTGWATAVSLHAVVIAALVSMAEGVIFGFIPASRAAQLQPSTALRHGG